LRLGGLYLALATFALALATPQLLKFKAFDAYTGGVQGLLLTKPKAPIGIPLTRDQWLYFVCLAFAIPLFWAAVNLVHSRIGRALIAIRDHPIAAETMGVDASLYKTTTFGLSAAYTGVAGALMSLIVGFVSPDSFGLFLSLSFVVGIVVGGLASIPGVVVGALFIEFIPNVADRISDVIGESAKALPWAIYGVLLILIMYAAPSGAAGLATKLAQAVVRRRGVS
jgi:branched-chain amino acid transport system permease protein